MGNCQAVDAATLIIQHPNGKADKFYSPVLASQIMNSNPGHYVALLLSTTLYPPSSVNINNNNNNNNNNNSLRITRIKLLRPTDTLLLGHAYRLITTQEVTKGLCAKKQAKQLKSQPESGETHKLSSHVKRSEIERDYQVSKNESSREGKATKSRTRTWQPSLNSISESASSANHVS